MRDRESKYSAKDVVSLIETAGSEGARRATGDPAVPMNRIETQVKPFPKRRHLTTAHKLKALQEVFRLREGHSGQIGAYLRSEGLYYAIVSKWEKQLENGTLSSRRGPKKSVSDTHTKEKTLENANMLLVL